MAVDETDYQRALSYVAVRKEYEASLGCVAAAVRIVTEPNGDLRTRLRNVGRLLTPYEADIVDIQIDYGQASFASVKVLRSDKPHWPDAIHTADVSQSFPIDARGRVYGSAKLTRIKSWSTRSDRLRFSPLDVATVQLVCSQMAILADMHFQSS